MHAATAHCRNLAILKRHCRQPGRLGHVVGTSTGQITDDDFGLTDCKACIVTSMRSPSHRRKGKLPRTASSDAPGTHIDGQPHTASGPAHSQQSCEANLAIRPLFSSVRGREGVLSRRIAQYVEENEPPSITQATKRLLQRHNISDFTSHGLGTEARLASLF